LSIINKINKNSSTYIIAEIGFNHLGKLSLAEKMIKAASNSGTNAVKFQTFLPEEMVFKKSKHYNLIKNKNLKREEYLKLKKISRHYKMDFFSTPFDLESLKLLESIGVSHYKIASMDLNNFFLLNLISKTGKPVLLSTGMANIKEIEKSYNFLKKRKIKTFLLHCISLYPTDPKKLNLGFLDTLENIAGWKIGFSDHTKGIDSAAFAICKGAKIIEKHFTTDNKLPGADNKLSLNPKYMKKFVDKIRNTEVLIKSFRNDFSRDDTKQKKFFRRYLYAKYNMPKNSVVNEKNLLALRPLRPVYENGVDVSKFFLVKGKKTKKMIKKFEKIVLKSLI